MQGSSEDIDVTMRFLRTAQAVRKTYMPHRIQKLTNIQINFTSTVVQRLGPRTVYGVGWPGGCLGTDL